jgi:hypothetical protein
MSVTKETVGARTLMTEHEARKHGLQYTGHYNNDKEIVKAKAEEIRKSGFRAVVVTIPHSPLSRGYGGTGYTVYVERKYALSNSAVEYRKQLEREADSYKRLQDEYEKKLAEMKESYDKVRERLATVEAELNAPATV